MKDKGSASRRAPAGADAPFGTFSPFALSQRREVLVYAVYEPEIQDIQHCFRRGVLRRL
jgi:hypothetical protein